MIPDHTGEAENSFIRPVSGILKRDDKPIGQLPVLRAAKKEAGSAVVQENASENNRALALSLAEDKSCSVKEV